MAKIFTAAEAAELIVDGMSIMVGAHPDYSRCMETGEVEIVLTPTGVGTVAEQGVAMIVERI